MIENFQKSKNKRIVSFSKKEINDIMAVYSKKIAIGEWKDYSIDFNKNFAMFCIHKSLSKDPEYKILKKKIPERSYIISNKQRIISKSTSLKVALRIFKKPKLRLIK